VTHYDYNVISDMVGRCSLPMRR